MLRSGSSIRLAWAGRRHHPGAALGDAQTLEIHACPAHCRIGGPEVLTFRETILAAAEALGKRREQVRVVALPVLPLRILAAALGVLGMLWPAAAKLAGGLRFMLYASSHDSGG
jgi:hypothetical protein